MNKIMKTKIIFTIIVCVLFKPEKNFSQSWRNMLNQKGPVNFQEVRKNLYEEQKQNICRQCKRRRVVKRFCYSNTMVMPHEQHTQFRHLFHLCNTFRSGYNLYTHG